MSERLVSDEFLDSRFDPKNKKLFQERFESDRGQNALERDYNIPVTFLGDFDRKIEQVLTNLVNSVLSIADNHELRVEDSNPSIVFFTESAWLAEQSGNRDQLKNLPASEIMWRDGDPFISVVLSPKIESFEIIIKTARLLFLNLFGKLYIDELVKKGLYFKTGVTKSIEFDFGEKIGFCKFSNEFPNQLVQRFKELGKMIKSKNEKNVIEFGKKEFFRILDQTWQNSADTDGSKSDLDLIENAFLYHQALAQNDPDNFYQCMVKRHDTAQTEIGIVLPHEKSRFDRLKRNKQWAYFDSFYERLQYILNSINDLQESFTFLNDESELTEFSLSDYWIKNHNNRMLHLKSKGCVKLFLIDDAKLTIFQEKDKQEFPLWIWRKGLFKAYSSRFKPEQLIKLITSQYKNSIYQKLFEALSRATNCLKNIHKISKADLKTSGEFKRLKALMIHLNIRKQPVEELFVASRLIPQMIKSQDSDSANKEEKAISLFSQGWSYFISFALIHQHYLKKGQSKKTKADKFLEIVKKFIEARIDNQAAFQVAYLFFQMYNLSHHDLGIPLKIVKTKTKGLEFFIVNIDKVMTQNQPKKEIILSKAKMFLLD